MRVIFRTFAYAAVAFFLLTAPGRVAFADTLVQVTSGVDGFSGPEYFGQSFTVLGAGTYDDITFNFYDRFLDPYASGTGYLFSAAYTGTPAGLSSSDAGFLGSAVASGGVYDFASSVDLVAGQQYFFYEDTILPAFSISGNASYSGGDAYISGSSSSDFSAIGSANFLVTGSPTPEPSSLALLGTGLLSVFGLARRKDRSPL